MKFYIARTKLVPAVPFGACRDKSFILAKKIVSFEFVQFYKHRANTMFCFKRIVIFVFILALTAALFLFGYIYQKEPAFQKTALSTQTYGEGQKIFTVRGTSLAPRVPAGAKMLLTSPEQYRRNDIVMIRLNGRDDVLAKIIKAVPGDKWRFADGFIYVNGKVLENSRGEQYNIRSEILDLSAKNHPVIPENNYLLLGDLPSGSIDSGRFGLVSANQIIGALIPFE